MINAYRIEHHKLISEEDVTKSVWVDLLDPTVDERNDLKGQLGQSLASFLELEDIEASARFFEDEDGLHLHTFFYDGEMVSVAFTLREGRLFTLRDRDLTVFRLYRLRSRNAKLVSGNAYEILLDLLDAKVEQLADMIEDAYAKLENINKTLAGNDESNNALVTLTEQEDICSQVRLCLMDTQRALGFLVRKTRLPSAQLEQAREILRDIESLQPHNESLFQKINFLMSATMGYINIEQNRIMKFFSVVSVMFLPATLIASMYGMNFEMMPELKFKYGYPMAIGMMILAASTPYFYFKRKKWI